MIDYTALIPDLASLPKYPVALENKPVNFDSRSPIVSNSEIPDKVRRFIASRPSMCISAAFFVGGFLGWLTSKR